MSDRPPGLLIEAPPHLARPCKTFQRALAPRANGPDLPGTRAVHADSVMQADPLSSGPSAGQAQLSRQLVQELVWAAVTAPAMHDTQPPAT